MVLKRGQQLPPYVGAVANVPPTASHQPTGIIEQNISTGNVPKGSTATRGMDKRKKKQRKLVKKIDGENLNNVVLFTLLFVGKEI